MAALSEHKIEIVRQLVAAAPDRVVGGLQLALAETADDSALAGVRRLVETEALDRRLRNTALQPLAPMCVGDGKDASHLVFPAYALALLWRGLKSLAPEAVADAAAAFEDQTSGESANPSFDMLAAIASAAVRAREPREFALAAEVCDEARPGGAGLLADCLDIAPVVRAAIPKLADWNAHFGDETTASARLAYKDAVAIADDAGPRFFEMLAAQLPHPWMVLRIISAVMDKPTERYLADSEMAVFGERVMREIDASLKAVSSLDPDGGPDAGRGAGKRVELITYQISEMETCVDLSRDHGWGHELVKQKKTLAAVVEGHLRTAEKLTIAALPMQTVRIARMRKTEPKLNTLPDPVPVRRALTLLAFSHEVRSSANYGGFGAARSKMLETLGDMLDNYVQEVLDHIRTGDAPDEEVAYAYLEIAAEISLLVRDERAAELVRRRAAAVRHDEAAAAVASGQA
ncbi:MAG TPA: hypothetical protein VLI41_12590 [Phenylobacterium sp.]|uniref:hypothetical protein n=1 Tax=Phenylobacterium sp. TaxID=1871053 RepID=UPI002BC5A999|nr:hypothetical protein [Phenylobacterium sp.]HSV04033.1 hypothetical protein [Phenylobacterium sp.]